MPNRLLHSTSPYLLQHAHQPVDWYPWGTEALEKAKRENKPIFLSIGYAACHWCHVMAHESFEDPDIARLLNEHFVSIKVDREEHPDVDRVYMQAVIAMTGHGGWPLSVFLTPEGEPFYGGTYYPPEPRHGLPSFRQVLEAIIQAWREDPEGIRRSASQMKAHLQERLRVPLPESSLPLHRSLLEEAQQALRQGFDERHGGWGNAPKFPSSTLLEFLFRLASRGSEEALIMALRTCAGMAQGGMYDVLGGGFHRYSVDAMWWVPHFEKMLYDNALLARVYLYGYLLTRAEPLRQVVEETLTFLERDMRHPQGGFYSSLDADTEGEEGRTYTWTPEEVEAILPPEERELFRVAYGLTGPPQMEGGRYVLRRVYRTQTLSQRFGIPPEDIEARLASARRRLWQARQRRPQPEKDDKLLLGWNALTLWAFAEAGFYLKRQDWLQRARETAHVLLTRFRQGNAWFHVWHQGRRGPSPAYLEDHAALGLALLALYRADPQAHWYRAAMEQVHLIEDRFADEDDGWADTPQEHKAPLVRPRTLEDQATPSGIGLTVTLWLQVYGYTQKERYRKEAEQLLQRIAPILLRYPHAFGQWLCALDLVIGPLQEIALLSPTPEEGDFRAFVEVLQEQWRPRSLWGMAFLSQPEEELPPLLRHRPLLQGRVTAYVCQNFVCQAPTTDPMTFREQMNS